MKFVLTFLSLKNDKLPTKVYFSLIVPLFVFPLPVLYVSLFNDDTTHILLFFTPSNF